MSYVFLYVSMFSTMALDNNFNQTSYTYNYATFKG